MKVADSALYTVTRASRVIFLISLLVGSPRQNMVTHPCDKTLNTWQRADMGHTLSSFDSALGLRPSSAIKIASGIYPYRACCHVLPVTYLCTWGVSLSLVFSSQ